MTCDPVAISFRGLFRLAADSAFGFSIAAIKPQSNLLPTTDKHRSIKETSSRGRQDSGTMNGRSSMRMGGIQTTVLWCLYSWILLSWWCFEEGVQSFAPSPKMAGPSQQRRQPCTHTIPPRIPFSVVSGTGGSATALCSAEAGMFPNEFSRTVSPARLQSLQAGGRQGSTNRQHSLSIAATPEECQALASRFDLVAIDSLEAAVVLQSASRSSSTTNAAVHVQGTVEAQVTRTCVRTNQAFSQSLTLSLVAVVRPVVPLSQAFANNHHPVDQDLSSSKNQNKNKSTKKRTKKNVSYRSDWQEPPDWALQELQQQFQEFDDDDYDDADGHEVMEDEAIFSTQGPLDVGELVAQLFWLSLDPYPKQPGSEPIQTSLTG